jgi:hypothetical protein
VFKPRKNDKGEERYSVTMIFDKKEDLAALRTIAQAAGREKFGEKLPPGFRGPFRDGADKKHLEGFGETVVFATATTTTQPGLVDLLNGKRPITEPTAFYAGCYARATVTAYGYDRNGNRGVSFSLHNLIKVKDGKPISGRSSPDVDFEAMEAPEGAGDPLYG